MKLKKTEQYEAGYSAHSLLKKCAAGALGAAMLGSMTACTPQYDGNMVIDGDISYVTPSDVSPSDVSTGSELPLDGKVMVDPGDDGQTESGFTLDGDVIVSSVPEDGSSR
ncbi:MAG: hypothetical protein II828_00990 [Clostridia bacterium]|nr:hypothetical protein [Clostridia bacterium]